MTFRENLSVWIFMNSVGNSKCNLFNLLILFGFSLWENINYHPFCWLMAILCVVFMISFCDTCHIYIYISNLMMIVFIHCFFFLFFSSVLQAILLTSLQWPIVYVMFLNWTKAKYNLSTHQIVERKKPSVLIFIWIQSRVFVTAPHHYNFQHARLYTNLAKS